jgi:hypothetical protein
LLWAVLLVVLLIVLSVLFGGFQKGTQYKGFAPVGGPGAAAPAGLARPVAVAVASERRA